METLHIQFHRLKDGYAPYVLTLYSYKEEANETSVEFDGYLYAKDEDFPVRCIAVVIQTDSTQPHTSFHAIIEIYKRITIKDTSVYSEMDDEGESMNVCFFPTQHQKIWFRIVEHIA